MRWDLKYCDNCKEVYVGPEIICSECKGFYLVSQFDSDIFYSLSEDEKKIKLGELFENADAEISDKLKSLDNQNSNQTVEPQSYRYEEDATSGVGSAIKTVSVIVIIISVIGSFVIMSGAGFPVGAAVLIVSVLTGLLAYGIGEICTLLVKINSKIDKVVK